MKTTFTTKKLTMIGLFAALVFASSFISTPPIATPLGETRLHIGNALCLLSGFILGPLSGGLAAGIGSMFFDIINPAYIASAPFTLVFKFMLAWVCGKIAYSGENNGLNVKVNIWAAIAGSLTYIVLYLGKGLVTNVLFLRTEMATALIATGTKAFFSSLNAAIAVIASVPLAAAIRKAVKTI